MSNPYDNKEETQPESGWIYVAPAEVQHSAARIKLPDGLFEAGIIDSGGEVNWAYDKVVGILIISNEELEDMEYNNVAKRTVLSSPKNYCKVPSEFFPPSHDASTKKITESVDENAYVRRGERRHFVYQVGMDEGEKRSCYLLTDEELMDRLSGPEDWVGNFESKPQFF